VAGGVGVGAGDGAGGGGGGSRNAVASTRIVPASPSQHGGSAPRMIQQESALESVGMIVTE